MARCGWCAGTKVYQGRACVCSSGRRPYFPSKAKKKANDLLPSGHRHDKDEFLYETGSHVWYTCSCGTAHKVSVDA